MAAVRSVEVSFITGDISQLTSTIKTDDVSYTAGGKIKVSVTLMDEQKNLGERDGFAAGG